MRGGFRKQGPETTITRGIDRGAGALYEMSMLFKLKRVALEGIALIGKKANSYNLLTVTLAEDRARNISYPWFLLESACL